LRRDYSQAGKDRPTQVDRYGMPTYDKRFGALTWGKHLVPTYLWYDGTRTASLVGDKIDPASPVILNAPVGEKRNPSARIYPFQVHAAVQPYDTEKKILALPKLLDGYWVDFDWSKAIADGMQQVGLPYSGKYGFVETRMYSAVHHQVLPEHRRAVYPAAGHRLDFKALGYPDDPAHVGGRFYISIGRGAPPK
jgi:hypothetical protein